VGIRTGLSTKVEEKSLASAGNRTPVIQSMVTYHTDRAPIAPFRVGTNLMSPTYLFENVIQIKIFIKNAYKYKAAFPQSSYQIQHIL
jgi:hypothetical protein